MKHESIRNSYKFPTDHLALERSK